MSIKERENIFAGIGEDGAHPKPHDLAWQKKFSESLFMDEAIRAVESAFETTHLSDPGVNNAVTAVVEELKQLARTGKTTELKNMLAALKSPSAATAVKHFLESKGFKDPDKLRAEEAHLAEEQRHAQIEKAAERANIHSADFFAAVAAIISHKIIAPAVADALERLEKAAEQKQKTAAIIRAQDAEYARDHVPLNEQQAYQNHIGEWVSSPSGLAGVASAAAVEWMNPKIGPPATEPVITASESVPARASTAEPAARPAAAATDQAPEARARPVPPAEPAPPARGSTTTEPPPARTSPPAAGEPAPDAKAKQPSAPANEPVPEVKTPTAKTPEASKVEQPAIEKPKAKAAPPAVPQTPPAIDVYFPDPNNPGSFINEKGEKIDPKSSASSAPEPTAEKPVAKVEPQRRASINSGSGATFGPDGKIVIPESTTPQQSRPAARATADIPQSRIPAGTPPSADPIPPAAARASDAKTTITPKPAEVVPEGFVKGAGEGVTAHGNAIHGPDGKGGWTISEPVLDPETGRSTGRTREYVRQPNGDYVDPITNKKFTLDPKIIAEQKAIAAREAEFKAQLAAEDAAAAKKSTPQADHPATDTPSTKATAAKPVSGGAAEKASPAGRATSTTNKAGGNGPASSGQAEPVKPTTVGGDAAPAKQTSPQTPHQPAATTEPTAPATKTQPPAATTPADAPQSAPAGKGEDPAKKDKDKKNEQAKKATAPAHSEPAHISLEIPHGHGQPEGGGVAPVEAPTAAPVAVENTAVPSTSKVEPPAASASAAEAKGSAKPAIRTNIATGAKALGVGVGVGGVIGGVVSAVNGDSAEKVAFETVNGALAGVPHLFTEDFKKSSSGQQATDITTSGLGVGSLALAPVTGGLSLALGAGAMLAQDVSRDVLEVEGVDKKGLVGTIKAGVLDAKAQHSVFAALHKAIPDSLTDQRVTADPSLKPLVEQKIEMAAMEKEIARLKTIKANHPEYIKNAALDAELKLKAMKDSHFAAAQEYTKNNPEKVAALLPPGSTDVGRVTGTVQQQEEAARNARIALKKHLPSDPDNKLIADNPLLRDAATGSQAVLAAKQRLDELSRIKPGHPDYKGRIEMQTARDNAGLALKAAEAAHKEAFNTATAAVSANPSMVAQLIPKTDTAVAHAAQPEAPATEKPAVPVQHSRGVAYGKLAGEKPAAVIKAEEMRKAAAERAKAGLTASLLLQTINKGAADVMSKQQPLAAGQSTSNPATLPAPAPTATNGKQAEELAAAPPPAASTAKAEVVAEATPAKPKQQQLAM